MGFGFDNDNLKGVSPFSFINVDTTYLSTTGRLPRGKDMFGKTCWEKPVFINETIFTNSLFFRKDFDT